MDTEEKPSSQGVDLRKGVAMYIYSCCLTPFIFLAYRVCSYLHPFLHTGVHSDILFSCHSWVTGTGGGISMRRGEEIYIAPSGVQKERIQPDDMFICDINGADISTPPAEKKLKKSQCTPLFLSAF